MTSVHESATRSGLRGVPATSTGQDLVTAAFGTWLIIGLFTDAWAHLNLPGLESFFTPWHALLYSGFAASAAWVGLSMPGRRRGLSWPDAVPVGYRLAAVGVLLFGAGGLGDMVWHVVFGVETVIDALVSPTHLVLLTGGALVLATPLRAGWARAVAPDGLGLRSELPAMVSLALVTALAAFFLLYVSVFTSPAAAGELTSIPEGAPGHDAAEMPTAVGLAGYVVTTVVLVAPLLLAQRAGRRPPGAVLLVVGVVSWLSIAAAGFERYGVAAATAVSVAAVVVELVLRVIDKIHMSDLLWLVVLAAVVPALIWPAQLVAVVITEGLRWPVELWSGVVGLSVLVAVAVAAVVGWTPRSRVVEQGRH
jgi:hypothetical protein